MDKVYVLMHGDYTVAHIGFDSVIGWVNQLLDVIDSSHLPPSVQIIWNSDIADNVKIHLMSSALQKFWKNRLMSSGRFHCYKKRNFASISALESYGMNLSDAWWVKNENDQITWNQINCYENSFKSYFDEPHSSRSPDFCTNGNLPKFWNVHNGKRVLYKQGNNQNSSEAYNEAIADKLLDSLGFPHVHYTVNKRVIDGKDEIFSICPAFTGKNVEYIPAWYIGDAVAQEDGESRYDHFLKCAKARGIPDIKEDLNNMLAFDYLINNTDRHYGNFGFLRNPNTLQWIGLAPIFDNGNSLWFDQPYQVRFYGYNLGKPFWRTQNEILPNIPLIEAFQRLDDEIVRDCIEQGSPPSYSKDMIKHITRAVLQKKKRLCEDREKMKKVTKKSKFVF